MPAVGAAVDSRALLDPVPPDRVHRGRAFDMADPTLMGGRVSSMRWVVVAIARFVVLGLAVGARGRRPESDEP